MSISINCDELRQLLFIMDTTKTYVHVNHNEEIKEFTSMVKEYAPEYYFTMADTWHINYQSRNNCIGVNHVNHMISIRDCTKVALDGYIIEYRELYEFINKSYNLNIDIMSMI